MKLSLREVCIKAVEAYGKIPRNEWVLQYPGQIVLAASQVHWTTEVTQVSRQPSIHFMRNTQLLQIKTNLNSADLDQMPQNVASDLDLHCLLTENYF